jgi:hypothetical protein
MDLRSRPRPRGRGEQPAMVGVRNGSFSSKARDGKPAVDTAASRCRGSLMSMSGSTRPAVTPPPSPRPIRSDDSRPPVRHPPAKAGGYPREAIAGPSRLGRAKCDWRSSGIRQSNRFPNRSSHYAPLLPTGTRHSGDGAFRRQSRRARPRPSRQGYRPHEDLAQAARGCLSGTNPQTESLGGRSRSVTERSGKESRHG